MEAGRPDISPQEVAWYHAALGTAVAESLERCGAQYAEDRARGAVGTWRPLTPAERLTVWRREASEEERQWQARREREATVIEAKRAARPEVIIVEGRDPVFEAVRESDRRHEQRRIERRLRELEEARR